jgi:hypothetical protein
MNVEIGTEAAQFPEKDKINGIFVAVRWVLQESYIFVWDRSNILWNLKHAVFL